MTITDISKKYEYHSVQEFCAIAKTFGYNYQYNRGYFLFSKDGNDFRLSTRAITTDAREIDRASVSMKKVAGFFDKNSSFFPTIPGISFHEKKNREFIVVDKVEKTAYTSSDLFYYGNRNGFLLDGKGTCLRKGELSSLIPYEGKLSKLLRTEEGILVFQQEKELNIPDEIQGIKLTENDKTLLKEGKELNFENCIVFQDLELKKILEIPKSFLLDSSYENILSYLDKHPEDIRLISSPGESLQLQAVQKDGKTIRFLENPSERVQLTAVKQDGEALLFLDNPSENVQLAAVNELYTSIRYIKEPSERVQLAAVKQNPEAIQYIKKPSEEVQIAAVKIEASSIRHIENPSERVKTTALLKNPEASSYIKEALPEEKKIYHDSDFEKRISEEDYEGLVKMRNAGYSPSPECINKILRKCSSKQQAAIKMIFNIDIPQKNRIMKSKNEQEKLQNKQKNLERTRAGIHTINTMFNDL
ncbi:DUF3945 domain-containing protein [Bacteroides pyogenes]|uniref:DUF3945 domain-containing protein n=1 Tax=Bacteroides pyogenes TaxID=310300 RepID=A0A5D3ECN7_9BACE|nr:DUF3945 domain-containing protein [Bacteroides pyogenes]TYK32835.1 DUF3945 domain-containing protein [Bacteroides pyogenes]